MSQQQQQHLPRRPLQLAIVGTVAVVLVSVTAWQGYRMWQGDAAEHEHAGGMPPAQNVAANTPSAAEITAIEFPAPDVAVDPDAPVFTDVTVKSGIEYEQHLMVPMADGTPMPLDQHGGAVTADYDNDGWADLFVTRAATSPILYRNLGPNADGMVTFADVTAQAGLGEPDRGSNGALFADFDNDGDPDLFVTTVSRPRYYLFINQGDGTFREEAEARGADVTLTETGHYGHSAAAGDYDNDGYLDLAIGEWGVRPREPRVGFRLLRNLGEESPGHFTDVTESAGIVTIKEYDPEGLRPLDNSLTPRFTDLDGDGHVDLAIASDYRTSALFWNNGDGTFTDGTQDAAVSTGRNEMGVSIADYDGDGRLDWFVTSISAVSSPTGAEGNRLYRNEGDRMFSERAVDVGVADAGWGWAAAFFDYDNDSDLDLIATNGFHQGPRYQHDPSRLWRNNGEGGNKTTFSDIASASGITDTALGRGVVVFDYDKDGDLDVFISNQDRHGVLYRNDGGNRSNWLRLQLTGTTSNRDAAGALITVTDQRLKWPLVHETSQGSNFLSQSESIAHFGLGSIDDTVQRVTVRWPSGAVQELTDVSVNQVLSLTEPAEGGGQAVSTADVRSAADPAAR